VEDDVKNYELLYITRADITDQDLSVVRLDIQNKISALDGVVEKEEPWGKRQLAYEVNDQTEGIYTLIQMKMPSEGPVKLKEHLKIDERVIRYMITSKDRRKKPV
jgi:small subunit ribosomal protein S6